MVEVKTLARGLRVLESLASSASGQTTTELARAFSVDKGSMSRLLSTLEAHRFVERDPHTRRYYLSVYIQELAQRAGQHSMIRELVLPYLQQLGLDTSENAHVAICTATHAVTIADVPSTAALRVVSEVGRTMPLHCSAVGKCLVAFTDTVLPHSLTRFTANTLTTLMQIENDLSNIRKHGYALDDEELTLGVRGLAAPLRNREGRVIAAVGISGPTVRITDDAIPELVGILVQAAEAMSSELGYQH